MPHRAEHVTPLLADLARAQKLLSEKQRDLLDAIVTRSSAEADLQVEVEALTELVMTILRRVQEAFARE